VHQQRRGGARLVRVQSLRNNNEPDSERIAALGCSNAVNQTPALTVQLVDNHGVKRTHPGIRHQALEAGSRGLSPGNYVLIRVDQLPTATLYVFG
jgi:hypothetical protein